MLTTSMRISKINFPVLSVLLLFLCAVASNDAQTSPAPVPRIYAQKLVEQTLAAHPELLGLELAATPPGKTQCVTIASSETKGIGEKCDKDEFTAMKTNKPFIEKEKENGKEVYDVTIPIHDANGKIIATAGIDFKPAPDQSDAKVTELSQQIAKELETKVTTKERLFEPVG
ncbi:MAG TPA: PDC sensor domain-containing protein [Candidatus Bathyarchaeia archaeon]|jgi:iron complex outermembrane receptor protein|nr:PDC sensor domain-containing protein [Candidatus Bathyarchaeia archaeon]